ncbi:MAG: hypothetical protein ACLFPJ_01470 [Candidatus Woesearchaeota archaeon]
MKHIKKIKKSIFMVLILFSFLIFSMFSFADDSYSFDVYVIDGFDNKLGDVTIKLDNNVKKTNVNGYTSFKDVFGVFELVANKSGFKSVKKTVRIDDNKNFTIILEKEKLVGEKLPKITISSFKNNSILDNEKLKVKFNVNSNTNIDNCRLLISEIDFFGFKYYDHVENVLSDNLELNADLDNGLYDFKISCQNNLGISFSNLYRVEVINVKDDKLVKKNENNRNKDDENEITNTNSPSYLNKYNNALKKVDDAVSFFDSLDSDAKKMIEKLDYFKILKDKMEEIEKLKEQRINLENLKISESSYKSRNDELLNSLNKELNDLPVSIDIKHKDYFVESISEEDTFNNVFNYYASKSADYSEKKVSRLVKNIRKNHENFVIYTRITVFDVLFASSSVETINYVDKRIELDEEFLSDGFFVEFFNMDEKLDSSKIISNNQYELVSSNPLIIKFSINDLDYLEKNNEINFFYFIKDDIDNFEFENLNSIFILNEDNSRNLITGLNIFDSNIVSYNNWSYFILFFILSSFIVGFFYLKNTNLQINSFSKNLVFSKNNNLGNNMGCVHLIEKAIDLIKNNDSFGAIKLYPLIIQSYENLGVRSKNEIKPIISYLSGLVDLDYLSSKIDVALNLINHGQYDSKDKLFIEIEDVYSTLPTNLALKINEKYSYYLKMIDLLNLRKREEMRNLKESYDNNLKYGKKLQDDNIAINDLIYGK